MRTESSMRRPTSRRVLESSSWPKNRTARRAEGLTFGNGGQQRLGARLHTGSANGPTVFFMDSRRSRNSMARGLQDCKCFAPVGTGKRNGPDEVANSQARPRAERDSERGPYVQPTGGSPALLAMGPPAAITSGVGMIRPPSVRYW